MPACGIFYEGYLAGSATLWYTAPRHDALWVLPARTRFNASILASQSDASFQSLSPSRRRANGYSQRLIRVVRPHSVHSAILGINHEHHSREYQQIAPDMKMRVLQNWSVLGFFFPPFGKWTLPVWNSSGRGKQDRSRLFAMWLNGKLPKTDARECGINTDIQVKTPGEMVPASRGDVVRLVCLDVPVCVAMKSDASSSFILAILFAKSEVCRGGE